MCQAQSHFVVEPQEGNGPAISEGESRQGNGEHHRDDRLSGEFIPLLAWRFCLILCVHSVRSPLRPQEHVHDQIGSFRHEIPGIFGTKFWLIRFVDHGELVVRIVCVVPPI